MRYENKHVHGCKRVHGLQFFRVLLQAAPFCCLRKKPSMLPIHSECLLFLLLVHEESIGLGHSCVDVVVDRVGDCLRRGHRRDSVQLVYRTRGVFLEGRQVHGRSRRLWHGGRIQLGTLAFSGTVQTYICTYISDISDTTITTIDICSRIIYCHVLRSICFLCLQLETRDTRKCASWACCL